MSTKFAVICPFHIRVYPGEPILASWRCRSTFQNRQIADSRIKEPVLDAAEAPRLKVKFLLLEVQS
ncbi:hypothetical protein E4U43_005191 [Claviceps pusilla]|uniref:Uncharacterized protein n=1 Tax=Claviceps pusilla TaxID=123648 RepID=A0A9P7N2D4_9HYPO|nr:hypothetical protein E4U43_005191 [Claviceps pusilla]